MKKLIKVILIMIFSFMILIPSSYALEEKFVSKADDNVNLEKQVLGSSALAGNNINSNEKVSGILFAAGNNIKINNEVDYLIIAGNSIDINNTVNNDVILAGNNINISSDSVINRDVIITGNTVNISGKIGRNVEIYASLVNINDAVISGNIVVSAEKISVDEDSVISKKLSYNEDASIDISNKGNISEIEKTDKAFEQPSLLDIMIEKLLSFVRMLVVLFALILLVPSLFKKINKQLKDKNVSDILLVFGKGLIGLIVIPIASLILIISNYGISLGFILVILYGILMYISTIFTGYYLGKVVSNRLIKKDINNFLIGTIGLLIIYLLKLIPYVNSIVSFLSIIFGLGIVLNLFKNKK